MKKIRELLWKNLKIALTLNTSSAKGFSLIELLVVIAIIAILAAIAIPQYNKYRANAMLSNVQGFAKDIVQMAEGLVSTAGQNPQPQCRYGNTFRVITVNATDVNYSQICYPTSQCYLMALSFYSGSYYECDKVKVDVPSWADRIYSNLWITIYGTEVQITDGYIKVYSKYQIGNGVYIGCIYYPHNDTLADIDSTYVCRTNP